MLKRLFGEIEFESILYWQVNIWKPNFFNTSLSVPKVLIEHGVNVRESANSNSTKIGSIKANTEVELLETGAEEVINGTIDNWYKINTGNGLVGFVYGTFTSLKNPHEFQFDEDRHESSFVIENNKVEDVEVKAKSSTEPKSGDNIIKKIELPPNPLFQYVEPINEKEFDCSLVEIEGFKIGDDDVNILYFHSLMNGKPETRMAESGINSPGNEGSLFLIETGDRINSIQKKNNLEGTGMVDQSTNRAIQKYCANWNRDKTILESKVLGRWKADNNVTYELYNNGTGILNNKAFIWNIGESHHILKLSYPDRTTSSYNIKCNYSGILS